MPFFSTLLPLLSYVSAHTEAHYAALSLYFSSLLLIPVAGSPFPDHPQCLSGLLLGQAKAERPVAGFVMVTLASAKGLREAEQRAFQG